MNRLRSAVVLVALLAAAGVTQAQTSNNDLWEKVRARPNFSRNTQISACG